MGCMGPRQQERWRAVQTVVAEVHLLDALAKDGMKISRQTNEGILWLSRFLATEFWLYLVDFMILFIRIDQGEEHAL